MPCLHSKNSHFKNNGTVDGLFKIPMKCVQTGPTNRFFKLGQVNSEEAHPVVLCSDFAQVQ